MTQAVSVSSPVGASAQASSAPHSSHVLLTVLGTNPREACYSLNGQTVKAQLAPLALLSLLPPDQQPDRIVALCTAEASADSLPILRNHLPAICALNAITVPSGHSQADINAFLTLATSAIPTAAEAPGRISIDVTHGFRHFSFLTYIAGLYLVGLRDIELAGAWYGLLQSGESPFLDLRPLLELPRWIHALQVLRDTGSAHPLAEALQSGLSDQTARTIAGELRLISESYLSALPLELGQQVGKFRAQRLKAMTGLIRSSHQLPLAAELVKRLDQLLIPFGINEPPTGQGWKAQIPLLPEELQRQARFIDGLFAHQDDAMALGLLNEWTVSWALWCLDDTEHWLDFSRKRRRAASQLGALAAACQDPSLVSLLTDEQKQLGDFWHLLTNLRNGFHHHGMRREELVANRKIQEELERVISYWHHTLKACPRLSLRLGDSDGGAVLVSPIGHRPGVLYSALLASRERAGTEPSACLVICSGQSEAMIREVADRAAFRGPIIPLVLKDPYGGISEFADLRKDAQATCLRASQVLVNITGGTTLMGLAAQDLDNLARSLARPVQRFGLIDRRLPAEQEVDPYRAGEAFWLDADRGE